MARSTRLYLGDCPECREVALFTAVYIVGNEEMLTVIDCINNDHQIVAQVDAGKASGQPMRLQRLYAAYGLQPEHGPVYTVTENCTLELTD